jgi:hypothetical protein
VIRASPLFENKEYGKYQKHKSNQVIPLKLIGFEDIDCTE